VQGCCESINMNSIRKFWPFFLVGPHWTSDHKGGFCLRIDRVRSAELCRIDSCTRVSTRMDLSKEGLRIEGSEFSLCQMHYLSLSTRKCTRAITPKCVAAGGTTLTKWAYVRGRPPTEMGPACDPCRLKNNRQIRMSAALCEQGSTSTPVQTRRVPAAVRHQQAGAEKVLQGEVPLACGEVHSVIPPTLP
jgi:hypothetical protein